MTARIPDTSGQDQVRASDPRATRRRLLMGAALLAGVALLSTLLWPRLANWSEAQESISLERIRLATVSRGDLVRDVSVQGRVVAGVSPTLYASETGTVTFLASAGDTVVERAELATIDSPELANRLQQERSRLSQVQVQLEREGIQTKQKILSNRKVVDLAGVQLTAAGRESRRADLAYEKEAISEIDYEKAQDELESAKFAHDHAIADAALDDERLEFELKTRQLELEQQKLLVADLQRQVDALTIVSPVSGIVGNLLVAQKTNVARNQAVLSVVDLSQFEVEIRVPESYADDLAIGMTAEVRTGQAVHGATLVSVSPEIIDSQVTCRMRFDSSPPAGLRQNQRLTTRVLLNEQSDVLQVDRGQFLDSGGGRIAYRVEGDLARKTVIETGARSLNAIEITAGLSEGDVIIVSSTEVLNGADVVLINQ